MLRRLIARRATPTTAAHALNVLVILELCSRHPADACRVFEVGLLSLHATQAAEFLVSLFLPLGNQHRIGIAVFEQPVVQLLADRFLLVVQLVDVATPLMGDLENGPLSLVLGNIIGRGVLRILHLVAKN